MNLDLITKSKAAIGEEKPKDYKLKPTKFPEVLNKNASSLSNLLKRSSFERRAERYEKYSNEAKSAQKKFKTYAMQATWSICVAAISGSCLSAVSLYIVKFESNFIFTSCLFILGFISIAFAGLAVFRLHQIKTEKLFEIWMTERAKAEAERLGYFSALARYLFKNHKDDIWLSLLFACMFKRYQIEVQLLYYSNRCKEHRKSLEITSKIGAVAAICLAFGSGVLGMFGAFHEKVLPLAALGTIGAALSIVASRREEINQDGRNAERYTRTADILSNLSQKHDDILEAISEGKKSDLLVKYVDAVNDQLSLEHRQWTGDVLEMPSALAKLENSLLKGVKIDG